MRSRRIDHARTKTRWTRVCRQVVRSDTAKLRAKVILETMAGTCRLKEACQRLGISEQRFHQLREEMMAAAVKALEPGHAGRPVQAQTPTEEQAIAPEPQPQNKQVEPPPPAPRAQ